MKTKKPMLKKWRKLRSQQLLRSYRKKEDKEAVRETETKDKEAAENNDNYAEKVEKDEIIGGFSTSGETLNIFDPDIRDKGGGGKDRTEKNKLQSN